MAERVVRVGGDDPSLTIYPNPAKQALLGIGAFAFAVLGIVLIAVGDSVKMVVVGMLVVVVFGAFGVLWVRIARRAGPALVVDRRGITDRSSATPAGFVPWTEITGLGIWMYKGQRVLTVDVVDPEAVLSRVGSLARPIMRASMHRSGTPVNIATAALPFTTDQLLHEVAAFLPEPPTSAA